MILILMLASKNLRNYIFYCCVVRECRTRSPLYKLDLANVCVNAEMTRPNGVLRFRVSINQSRFRNPPSGRRAETNFRRSSSRSPHFYEVSVLSVRYGTGRVFACSLRNACTRCDAGIHSRTGRNSKPRNATGPVRPSSFTGQRTPLSHRYRGCHLLQHWPNHSEKPIDRGPIHFFSSERARRTHFFLRFLSEPRS